MKARQKRVLRALQRLQADGELVRLHRRKHLDTHDGYIQAVGERWLLLANLDPAVVLDGYIALRIRDIRKVRPATNAPFVRAALSLQGQWPPAPPTTPLHLTDTTTLLASLRDQWPLVTVHAELHDPGVCFIGQVRDLRRKTLRLHEITPLATWRPPRGKFRIKHLTRIDVGGRYEQALIQVATRADDPAHS